MTRSIDVLIAVCAGIVLSPIALLVAILVRATSPGPALYWSERIGKDERPFQMPKFRTMCTGTAAVASHLLADPGSVLTPIGGFLRRTSLDEIPQLWSVLRGDMALVGPRPALYNQADLIAMRRDVGVQDLRPGITGWAQINGRDELSIPAKVALDREYRDRRSFGFDLKILLLTARRLVGDKTVTH